MSVSHILNRVFGHLGSKDNPPIHIFGGLHLCRGFKLPNPLTYICHPCVTAPNPRTDYSTSHPPTKWQSLPLPRTTLSLAPILPHKPPEWKSCTVNSTIPPRLRISSTTHRPAGTPTRTTTSTKPPHPPSSAVCMRRQTSPRHGPIRPTTCSRTTGSQTRLAFRMMSKKSMSCRQPQIRFQAVRFRPPPDRQLAVWQISITQAITHRAVRMSGCGSLRISRNLVSAQWQYVTVRWLIWRMPNICQLLHKLVNYIVSLVLDPDFTPARTIFI